MATKIIPTSAVANSGGASTASHKLWRCLRMIPLAAILLLAGCSGLSDDKAQSVANVVADSIDTALGEGWSVPDTPLGQINVYVDRSLSIKPFITEGGSDYNRLIQVLDDVLATNTSFYGWGFEAGNSEQTVDAIDALQLQDASSYQFVNNDYTQLFSLFEPSETSTHLVISDGVQSDREAGARFRGIVRSIGDWINANRVFALLAYRSPYRGTYYNEVPEPGRIEYSCDDRPFYIYGFLPSVGALRELTQVLRDEGLNPVHELVLGAPSLNIRPLGRSATVESVRDLKQHTALGDIRSVYSGRLITDGSVAPLQYQVDIDTREHPWRALSDDERASVASSLEPALNTWEVQSMNEDSVSIQAVTRGQLEALAPKVGITSRSDTSLTANIELTVSATLGVENIRSFYASMLSVRPSPSGANRLIPASLSTRRDDQPSACSSTLNLRPTIGSVLREHYVLGHTLLVMEWR